MPKGWWTRGVTGMVATTRPGAASVTVISRVASSVFSGVPRKFIQKAYPKRKHRRYTVSLAGGDIPPYIVALTVRYEQPHCKTRVRDLSVRNPLKIHPAISYVLLTLLPTALCALLLHLARTSTGVAAGSALPLSVIFLVGALFTSGAYALGEAVRKQGAVYRASSFLQWLFNLALNLRALLGDGRVLSPSSLPPSPP